MGVGGGPGRPSSTIWRRRPRSRRIAARSLMDHLFAGHSTGWPRGCLGSVGAASWGNAAACASGAGAITWPPGPPGHDGVGRQAFLAAAPHGLGELGDWEPVPPGEGWAFHRRTCCLWWKTTTSGGVRCWRDRWVARRNAPASPGREANDDPVPEQRRHRAAGAAGRSCTGCRRVPAVRGGHPAPASTDAPDLDGVGAVVVRLLGGAAPGAAVRRPAGRLPGAGASR